MRKVPHAGGFGVSGGCCGRVSADAFQSRFTCQSTKWPPTGHYNTWECIRVTHFNVPSVQVIPAAKLRTGRVSSPRRRPDGRSRTLCPSAPRACGNRGAGRSGHSAAVPRAARADFALRQARSAVRQRPCPGLPKANPAAVGGGCGGPSGLFSPFALARGISAAPGSSARGAGGTGRGRAAHRRTRGSKTRLYRSGCREVLGDAGATELRNAAALVTRAGAAGRGCSLQCPRRHVARTVGGSSLLPSGPERTRRQELLEIRLRRREF